MWNPFRRTVDTRTDTRFDISIPARILVDGNSIRVDTMNLSVSGTKLLMDGVCRKFDQDERLRIEFDLPSSKKPVMVTARVRKRSEISSEGCYLHVYFEDISSKDRDRIAKIQDIVENPIEKRKEKRLFCFVEAGIMVRGRALEAHSKDISASGIRIEFHSTCNFTRGEILKVAIKLPGTREAVETMCSIKRVEHQDVNSDRRILALNYEQISDLNQQTIRKFVDRRILERKRLDLAS